MKLSNFLLEDIVTYLLFINRSGKTIDTLQEAKKATINVLKCLS